MKKKICYVLAALSFLIGVFRMIYGIFWAEDTSVWYDYLIELLFLSFIAAMILRLSKTFKN